MDIEIITKKEEVTRLEDKYDGEVFIGQEEITELVEKKYVVLKTLVEYDVYMAEMQQEKENSEKAILQAQEKIAEVDEKFQAAEEVLQRVSLLDKKK